MCLVNDRMNGWMKCIWMCESMCTWCVNDLCARTWMTDAVSICMRCECVQGEKQWQPIRAKSLSEAHWFWTVWQETGSKACRLCKMGCLPQSKDSPVCTIHKVFQRMGHLCSMTHGCDKFGESLLFGVWKVKVVIKVKQARPGKPGWSKGRMC